MENNSQNRNNTSSEEDEYTSTQPCDPSSDHFSQREMKEKPWAKLISLNSKYPSIEIIQNELTIGRRKTCTITFEDTKVSGIHCKIYRKFSNKKYEIFLEDLRFFFLFSFLQNLIFFFLLSLKFKWYLCQWK